MVQDTATIEKLLCLGTDKVCGYCGEYKYEDKQQAHICKGLNIREIIFGRLPCIICNIDGFTLSSLARHHRKVHKTDDFACIECLDTFNYSSALGKHREKHKQDRQETARDRQYFFLKDQVAGILKGLQPFDRECIPSLVLITDICFNTLDGHALKRRNNDGVPVADDVPVFVLSNNNIEMSKLLEYGIPVLKMPIEKEDVTEIRKYLTKSESGSTT